MGKEGGKGVPLPDEEVRGRRGKRPGEGYTTKKGRSVGKGIGGQTGEWPSEGGEQRI